MQLSFREPVSARYIYIDPATNYVHLMMSVVGGNSIGTDNTCRSTTALRQFWGLTEQPSAVNVLERYKRALEFDLSIIQAPDDELKRQKEDRLRQINIHIETLTRLRGINALASLTSGMGTYPPPLVRILERRDNVHSMLLRPAGMDGFIRSIAPVFSLQRTNHSACFYRELHSGLQGLPRLQTQSPEQLFRQEAHRMCGAQPFNLSRVQEGMAALMRSLFNLTIDFTRDGDGEAVTPDSFCTITGYSSFGEVTSADDIIDYLLHSCAGSVWEQMGTSPFSTITALNNDTREQLSILTQFLLGQINIYSYAHELTTANFGDVLDRNQALSRSLVAELKRALENGDNPETVVFDFINTRHATFGLSRPLSPEEMVTISQRFKADYQTVANAPHFDEFTLLAHDKIGNFIAHQSSICVDLATFFQQREFEHIEHRDYYAQLHASTQAQARHGELPHRNESVSHVYTIEQTNIEAYIRGLLSNRSNVDALCELLLTEVINTGEPTRIRLFQRLTPETVEAIQRSAHFRALRSTIATYITDPELQRSFNNVFVGEEQQLHLTIDMLRALHTRAVQIERPETLPSYRTIAEVERILQICEMTTVSDIVLHAENGVVVTCPSSQAQAIIELIRSAQGQIYLSPTMASSLYKEVGQHCGERSEQYRHMQSLNNAGARPAKIIEALRLLDINIAPDAISFPEGGYHGYILNVTNDQRQMIDDIHRSHSRFHLTPAMASALYTRLGIIGEEAQIGALDNEHAPNKIRRTLELLNIPFQNIYFNGGNGYWLEASEETQQEIRAIEQNPRHNLRSTGMGGGRSRSRIPRYQLPTMSLAAQLVRAPRPTQPTPAEAQPDRVARASAASRQGIGRRHDNVVRLDSSPHPAAMPPQPSIGGRDLRRTSLPRELPSQPPYRRSAETCRHLLTTIIQEQAQRLPRGSWRELVTSPLIEVGVSRFSGNQAIATNDYQIELHAHGLVFLDKQHGYQSIEDRQRQFTILRTLLAQLPEALAPSHPGQTLPEVAPVAGPSPRITMQRVAAFHEGRPLPANATQATLNCPQEILDRFRQTLRGTLILGSTFTNPYTGREERFPENEQDLNARHLQMLARLEQVNTSGAMNVDLYNGLLNADQVARIRCLVKATNTASLVTVQAYGGYGCGRTILPEPMRAIVIDQSGLQWQDDFRNTGGLFFYPENYHDPRLPHNYLRFQNEMYHTMYGEERPGQPTHGQSAPVRWGHIDGFIDLKQLADGIEVEFLQALDAVVRQGNSELSAEACINFKYLKAGMGFFAAGLNGPTIPRDLERARLKGIEQALSNIIAQPEHIKRALLGKVGRLELPFSDSNDPAIRHLLQRIESLVTTLELQWGGTPMEDVYMPRAGYVNASTNCGDPHAMTGNEGGHASVDAAMSSNASLDVLNPAFNEHIQLVASPLCANIGQTAAATTPSEVDTITAPTGLGASQPETAVTSAEPLGELSVDQLNEILGSGAVILRNGQFQPVNVSSRDISVASTPMPQPSSADTSAATPIPSPTVPEGLTATTRGMGVTQPAAQPFTAVTAERHSFFTPARAPQLSPEMEGAIADQLGEARTVRWASTRIEPSAVRIARRLTIDECQHGLMALIRNRATGEWSPVAAGSSFMLGISERTGNPALANRNYHIEILDSTLKVLLKPSFNEVVNDSSKSQILEEVAHLIPRAVLRPFLTLGTEAQETAAIIPRPPGH